MYVVNINYFIYRSTTSLEIIIRVTILDSKKLFTGLLNDN